MRQSMKMIFRHLAGSRAAFTLMEVNLAILIMAVGVLTMTSLYPLGFRESEAAHEDVRAAVVAEEVLGKLSAALSSRNITWEKWRAAAENAVGKSNNGGIGNAWMSYFTQRGESFTVESVGSANGHAKAGCDAIAAACSDATEVPSWTPDSKYAQGLVVQWGKRIVNGTAQNDFSRVSISFRMSRRPGALMSAPMYYTEVHFQGDQKEKVQ